MNKHIPFVLLNAVSFTGLASENPAEQLFSELEAKGTLECYQVNKPEAPSLTFDFVNKRVTDRTFSKETWDMDFISCLKGPNSNSVGCQVRTKIDASYQREIYLSYRIGKRYGKFELTNYTYAEIYPEIGDRTGISQSIANDNGYAVHEYKKIGTNKSLSDAYQFSGNDLSLICN